MTFDEFIKKDDYITKDTVTFDEFIHKDNYILDIQNKYSFHVGVELLERMKITCLGVEKEIKEIIEKEMEMEKEMEKEKENTCPICLESFTVRSYFTGKCGHKFCSYCICENMNKNMHTGHKCPLCRDDFM